MNFDWDEDDTAFRARLRSYLDESLPAWWTNMWTDDDRVPEFTRGFARQLAAKGWLTLSWPVQYGGAGAGVWTQTVLREEMWSHGEPRGPQYMSLNFIGPMIMRYGTDEQRERFLPPMARGEVVWCQGFSEPTAGSDLASMRTRADEDGDGFVVNGGKIWTSYADYPADWCLLIARTNPETSDQTGLSVFLLDMKSAGVTVRPIRSMAGPRDINEVLLHDVFIPRDCLLGAKNRGWSLVEAGLTFERTGVARYARVSELLRELIEYAKSTTIDGQRLSDDPYIRDQLAGLHCRAEAAQLLNYRVISLQESGAVPTVEAAISRVHNALLEQDIGHFGLEMLGRMGALAQPDPDAPLDGALQRQWVRNIPASIVAGSVEVQKNIIARRGLGLPSSRRRVPK
ncbi:MAG TPA: acyl-CoA dehydrogenase family protein [Trebonia sp.]|jgi:alkylation response protein AidB-like acyl-CoA dehydrogenase|nr:acyl-CoA dehydrogenase family protein [Trebonia sp.]